MSKKDTMKNCIVILFTMAVVTSVYSQTKDQLLILDKFITANNTGTHEAFSRFIHDTYDHDLLKRIDIERHIQFYTMISEDFGILRSTVYETIEEAPLRLVVHLIKENENILSKSINPEDVLVVEMDLDEQRQQYLKKGLGLGALFCALKKNE